MMRINEKIFIRDVTFISVVCLITEFPIRKQIIGNRKTEKSAK